MSALGSSPAALEYVPTVIVPHGGPHAVAYVLDADGFEVGAFDEFQLADENVVIPTFIRNSR